MNNIQFIEIKTAQARKSNSGHITYKVLKDSQSREVFFTITGNDGGGLYSKEQVSLDKIEQTLSSIDTTKGIRAKYLMAALVGRSSNTPGFLLLAMKQEGLFAPAGDASHLNVVSGDWEAWKQEILSIDGIAYTPAAAKANPFKAKASVNGAGPSKSSSQDNEAQAGGASSEQTHEDSHPDEGKPKKRRILKIHRDSDQVTVASHDRPDSERAGAGDTDTLASEVTTHADPA